MLYAYLDESYDSDNYFMGVAVAPPDAWDEVDERLADLRSQLALTYGTPEDIEFHAFEIMGGRYSWKPLRGKHAEAARIYRSALKIAHDLGVRYLLTGVDVHYLKSSRSYPDPPYTVVLRDALRMLNEYAGSCGEQEPVELMIDDASDQGVHEAAMVDHDNDGTVLGVRPGRFPRLSPHLNFRSSKQTPGLQVADLAAYLHRRRTVHTETNPNAIRARRSLERQLDPAVIATNYIGHLAP